MFDTPCNLSQEQLKTLCYAYLREQITPVKSLWEVPPAVERVIGFIEACRNLNGLKEPGEQWLRSEIRHTALGTRERLTNDFYPPGSSRQRQEIIEPAVNWWAKLNPATKKAWLGYLDTDSPIDAWEKHEQVWEEYEQRSKASNLAEANAWLNATLPKSLR